MPTRETILQVLEAAGHGAHRAQLDALIEPAVCVRASKLADRPRQDEEMIAAMDAAMAKVPIGASRFGGLPDLPPGVAWPERDGVPMEFVAQLRLADVAPHAPEGGLPAKGSLLFFYNSQWETSDSAPDAAVCAVIFHDDGDDASLVRTPAPSVQYQSEFMNEPYPAPWVHGLATLSFERFDAVPGGVSPYVTDGLKEIWQDFHCENFKAMQPETDDFGFHSLLGYVDGQDYVEAHQHGTEDRLLFKIDSDDAADFQWGDCDALYFIIPKAALAARDFTRVRLYSILG